MLLAGFVFIFQESEPQDHEQLENETCDKDKPKRALRERPEREVYGKAYRPHKQGHAQRLKLIRKPQRAKHCCNDARGGQGIDKDHPAFAYSKRRADKKGNTRKEEYEPARHESYQPVPVFCNRLFRRAVSYQLIYADTKKFRDHAKGADVGQNVALFPLGNSVLLHVQF